MKITLLALFATFTSSICNAGITDCGFQNINHIYTNSTRDDDPTYSNKLLIEVTPACNGKVLVYIENNNPAYNSFLSTALTAMSTGAQVRIYVNDSKVNQIAVMEVRK